MQLHLILAFGLLGAIVVAGLLVRTAIRLRAARLVGTQTAAAAPLPTVLYFTSERCAPCRVQQTPVLDTLRQRIGGQYLLRTVDVARDPDLAQRYRVMTAPTTIVLDQAGIVRAVNTGVASVKTLESQIRDALQSTPDSVARA